MALNLYASTPDSELIYTGNDYIVWDRVNNERISRGLPGLAAIGYPRPLDAPATGTATATNSGSVTEYTFTGMNGEVFKVSAPAGTSLADAQSAFEQQFNSGSLQSLGVGQGLGGLSAVASGALSSIKSLTNVALPTTLDPATILKTAQATTGIGSLDPKQVTGLIAQAGSLATQAGNIAGVPTSGIGQFNLSPAQLEAQGYLKPGTVAQYCSAGGDYTQILSSPTLWTGKGGASDLSSFIANPTLQTSTLTSVMDTSLAQLKSLGVVSGTESAGQLGALLQGSVTFGAAAMASWTQGIAPPSLTSAIDSIAKSGQQAISLVGGLPDIAPSIEGATKTVDRSAIDSSIKNILGNPKIPPAIYGPVVREAVTANPNETFLTKWEAASKAQLDKMADIQQRTQTLASDLTQLESEGVTQEGWDKLNNAVQAIKTEFNTEVIALREKLRAVYDSGTKDQQNEVLGQFTDIARTQRLLAEFVTYLKNRIVEDRQLIGT